MPRYDTLQVQTQTHTKSSECVKIVEYLSGLSMDDKKKKSAAASKWALTDSLKECVRRSREGDLQAAIDKVDKLDVAKAKTKIIRILKADT